MDIIFLWLKIMNGIDSYKKIKKYHKSIIFFGKVGNTTIYYMEWKYMLTQETELRYTSYCN